MSLIKVIETNAVSPGTMKVVKVAGKELLVANIDGSFFVIDNKCPHAHVSLARGKLEGCILTCPLHRAKFDVKSGKNLTDPKLLFLKFKTTDARSYEVTIADQFVLVEVA